MNKRKYTKGRIGTCARFGSLLCLVLLIASCVASKQSDPALPGIESQAVEKLLAGIVEAANAGDTATVMSYFAEDGVAMPTDEMPVFGTKLIRPRLQPLLDDSLFIFLTSEEVEVSGNFAFARGYVSGRMAPKNSAPTRYIGDNEYLAFLRKDSDGSGG